MEGLDSKSAKILPVLAMLGTMACATDKDIIADEKMAIALASMEKVADDLAGEFELAASKALSSSKVFAEIGSKSGEAILVNEPNTFGCVASSSGGGLLCEKAGITTLVTNPNLVSLNRDKSTLVSVGDSEPDLQIVTRDKPGQGQNISTMFLTDRSCAINTSGKAVTTADITSNQGLLKQCAVLRDKLRARLEKVMGTATNLKNHLKH